MIAQSIQMKLENPHWLAFQAFADRNNIKNTPEVVKRLIEALPEYQSLTNVHADATPSGGKIEDTNNQE